MMVPINPRYYELAALERASPPGPGQGYWVERLRQAEAEWVGRPKGPDLTGKLVVRAVADSSLGYGKMAAEQGKALEALGIPVVVEPVELGRDRLPLDPFVEARLISPDHGKPVLQIYPSDVPLTPGSILSCMYESTRPPPGWLEGINSARCLVVPCTANERWFRAAGATVPIRVVPLGIDPAVYFPDRPEPEGRFVVLASGNTGHGGERKGLDDAVSVFLEALGDRPDCSLRVKVWPECQVRDPEHPRITFDRTSYSEPGLAEWYRAGSLYMTLSRGEGWGLGPHEAMACGRPVVAPMHSGMADYLTEAYCYPVAFDPEPGQGKHYAGNGDWFKYRRTSAVAQLIHAYSNSTLRRAKGEAAATRAAEFTWERSGRILAEVVREFGLAPAAKVGPEPAPASPPAVDPTIRDRVNSCPDRGGVLPISMQPEGCRCGELSECRAGKGKTPGLVTLADCLACVG